MSQEQEEIVGVACIKGQGNEVATAFTKLRDDSKDNSVFISCHQMMIGT